MKLACLLIVALIACGDDGSEAPSLFGKRETKLKRVDLPSGSSTEIDPSAMSLVIDLSESGQIVIAGRAFDERDLDNVFRAAFVREPTTQVIIRAAKGAAHGRVVAIMEAAKAAGLTRLAIGTTPSTP